jgi:hypothetical protein
MTEASTASETRQVTNLLVTSFDPTVQMLISGQARWSCYWLHGRQET